MRQVRHPRMLLGIFSYIILSGLQAVRGSLRLNYTLPSSVLRRTLPRTSKGSTPNSFIISITRFLLRVSKPKKPYSPIDLGSRRTWIRTNCTSQSHRFVFWFSTSGSCLPSRCTLAHFATTSSSQVPKTHYHGRTPTSSAKKTSRHSKAYR